MGTVMSATQARVHFGEVLRRVRDNEIITVDHAGKPQAVILSVEEYERLMEHQPKSERWRELLMESRARVQGELGGREYPVDELIHRMREERDAELLEDLR
jgi:prevent-host-death family protein